jgi:hypothetical protein
MTAAHLLFALVTTAYHSCHPIRRAGPRRGTWEFLRAVSALGTNVNSESRAPTSVQDDKLKVRLKGRLR